MNNKTIMTGCALLAACAAVAMPTKKELAAAKQLVADITAPELEALKLRKKTAKEVGDFHMEQMKSAATEAERFHLLQGAFKLYARGKDYDAAAEALTAMNREIKDLPPEIVVELVRREMRRVAGEKAPKVLIIFNSARRMIKFQKQLPQLKKAVKAKPKDAGLLVKLAECHAELGDWPAALAAFAKSGSARAKIAKDELEGKVPPQTLADFWWDYGNPDDEEEMSVYRVHAAELYRKALVDPTFVGLQKSRAEMRVALAKDHLTLVAETVHVAEEQIAPPPPGCDFKINGNTATMVFPNGATMEFAKCPAGEFQMLYDYEKERTVPVKITRPFWFSKDVLKQKHLDSPTFKRRSDDDRAFVWEHWKFLAGNETKFFPRVNADFKKLLPKGYVIRLPSMAEFEYAYHANTKDRNDIFYGYNYHSWNEAGERMKNGNKWGIKDLFRWSVFMDRVDPATFGDEVSEPGKWRVNTCRSAKRLPVKPEAKDPFFWSEKDDAWGAIKGVMLSPERAWAPYDQIARIACHLVIGPDLVKEWKEKQAKKK